MEGILAFREQRAIIKLDPRTKLYILLAFGLITFASNTEGVVGSLKLIFAALAFLMLLNAKKPYHAFAYAAVYFAAYHGEMVWQYISSISVIGILIRILLVAILRMLPSVIMAWCFFQTTKVSEFITAMERMHITRKITIPFTVIFRFFPTVVDEYHSIQDAMKMRGIGIRKGPAAILEYRLVPLIVSIVKIGDELSAAAVTRGLGVDNKRTNYCRIGFGVCDIIFLVLISAAIAVFLIF